MYEFSGEMYVSKFNPARIKTVTDLLEAHNVKVNNAVDSYTVVTFPDGTYIEEHKSSVVPCFQVTLQDGFKINIFPSKPYAQLYIEPDTLQIIISQMITAVDGGK